MKLNKVGITSTATTNSRMVRPLEILPILRSDNYEANFRKLQNTKFCVVSDGVRWFTLWQLILLK